MANGSESASKTRQMAGFEVRCHFPLGNLCRSRHSRIMPMAQTNKIGGISFAGSNNRYNSFQIDGTVSNDVFGLTSSGTNGGQSGANPISMDAIQEIQVVVSPFDVRQGGFTGGGINAITKQGTNKFHGSGYLYYTNQDMYGRYNAAADHVHIFRCVRINPSFFRNPKTCTSTLIVSEGHCISKHIIESVVHFG